jgi:hypothetical protein
MSEEPEIPEEANAREPRSSTAWQLFLGILLALSSWQGFEHYYRTGEWHFGHFRGFPFELYGSDALALHALFLVAAAFLIRSGYSGLVTPPT